MLPSMERWYSMLPVEQQQQQIVTWLEQEGMR
jgi:hypothetical protein